MNKSFILILAFFFSSYYAKSVHLVGGEIITKYLNGTSYEVSVLVHYDFTGTIVPPNFSVTLEIFQRENPFLINSVSIIRTSIDSSVNYKCGTTIYDFATAYYVDTINFDTNTYNHPGGYLLKVNYGPGPLHPNLSTDVRQFYSLISPASINAQTFINNSPKPNLFSTYIMCQNENFALDCSATDIDGDSLAYKFFTPSNDGNPSLGLVDSTHFPYVNPTSQFNPITWAPGYGENTQIQGALPDSALNKLKLDPVSGELRVKSKQGNNGIYTVAIAYEEYRDIDNDGSKEIIGAVYRVIAFNVLFCEWSIHSAPTISYSQNINSSQNYTWNSDTLSFINNSISVPVFVTDPDSTAEIEMVINSPTLSASELSIFQNGDSIYSSIDTLSGAVNLNVLNSNLGIHKIQLIANNDQCDFVKSDTVEFWVNVNNSTTLDLQKLESWMVYPIPAKEKIKIKSFNEKIVSFEYRLYDVHGKMQFQGEIKSDEFELDLSLIPSGVYLLDLSGSLNERIRILVEN